MVLSGHWPSSKDKSEGPCDGHSQCAQRQTARLRVSLEPDSRHCCRFGVACARFIQQRHERPRFSLLWLRLVPDDDFPHLIIISRPWPTKCRLQPAQVRATKKDYKERLHVVIAWCVRINCASCRDFVLATTKSRLQSHWYHGGCVDCLGAAAQCSIRPFSKTSISYRVIGSRVTNARNNRVKSEPFLRR